MNLSNHLLIEFLLVAIAVTLWWADGRPGLSVVLGWLRAPVDRVRTNE